MNGIHDLGGMQGMGPVEYEKNEPVFHAAWEGRTYALTRALRAWRKWNIDMDRHALERMPAGRLPSDELLRTMGQPAVRPRRQVWSRDTRRTRKRQGSARIREGDTAVDGGDVSRFVNRGIPSAIDPKVPPRFKVGQRVRARNIHPAGHTRLPWYARGKRGTITRDHGVYSFPDTSAHALGDTAARVFGQFPGPRALGRKASARDFVHLDMWDAYLERG